MSKAKKTGLYILLTVSGFLMIFPILYAFLISFMQGGEVLQGKIIPSSFSLENYSAAFERTPLFLYIGNTFLVSLMVMAGELALASLAAFAFVFIRFKGRELLFFLFISTMMIPGESTVIPNFLTVQQLGWINSFTALTVPFMASAFGTFLLRQQFKTIPYELYEATRVAGISRFRFFWNIVLPISRTTLFTFGIYSFLTTWNMYLWPLLVTNDESVRTVQIGLKQMQAQELSTDWGVVMAAVIVVIIPTLLLLFFGQKQLRKGLTQGAIK
ncbi:carbohydrate ABC transporter permease [Sporolactobacillus sp. Y61]|uniref:Carbohydrate ABC transporter permease n=1 Tax=Sporolactobacillus sp. Y61 TaxID=3160863 RepID=A0AAU8IH62_9BACL